MFLPHPRVKVSIVGSLRDREVACSASDRQGLNFESCVWRTVSSQSSHHPQEVLLAQFSLYVHKGGLKPASFHFILFQTKHTYNMIIKEPTLHNSTQYIYKSRATYFHLSVQSIESHFLWSTSWLSALVINRYKLFATRQYYASIVPCKIHILISMALTKRVVEEFLKITGLVLLIINKIKN